MSNLPERLRALHSRAPQRTAIILQQAGREDLAISCDQLLCRAQMYARAMESQGIQPGEVVVLILQHGEELLYSFWGTILHGAIPSIMPFLTEKLSPERYRVDLA